MRSKNRRKWHIHTAIDCLSIAYFNQRHSNNMLLSLLLILSLLIIFPGLLSFFPILLIIFSIFFILFCFCFPMFALFLMLMLSPYAQLSHAYIIIMSLHYVWFFYITVLLHHLLHHSHLDCSLIGAMVLEAPDFSLWIPS